MPGSLEFGLEPRPHLLYDHRPLQLNLDDYSRVCKIPKKKVSLPFDPCFYLYFSVKLFKRSILGMFMFKVIRYSYIFLPKCLLCDYKGANFRDLEGVRVRPDNKVEWDPSVERVYLPSGKPLVYIHVHSFSLTI